MARRLQASQNQGQQAELAAWTAVVFATITALAVWGVANAYSLQGQFAVNQSITTAGIVCSFKLKGSYQ